MKLSDILPKENIVDKEATWKIASGVEFDVIVKDADLATNDRLVFQVFPKSGTGCTWVPASDITFKKKEKPFEYEEALSYVPTFIKMCENDLQEDEHVIDKPLTYAQYEEVERLIVKLTNCQQFVDMTIFE